HIGTGEGAQAYGWGLYFAGRKEVAEYYRENLSNRSISLDLSDGLVSAVRSHFSNYGGADTKRWARETANISDGEITKIDDWVDENESRPQGQLYEVKIPEDDVLLLWDKSFNEQPRAVKDAVI